MGDKEWDGTYDFESVRDDAHGHELFAVIAAIHHQRVCEAFDDGALGFAEALDGIAAGGVGDVDGGADLDVVTGGTEKLMSRFFWSPLIA